MTHRITLLLIGLAACLLAACTGITSEDDAASTVERYLTAKVASDRDALQSLLCSAQEANLDREAQSFSGVEASIQEMACQLSDDSNVVACSGAIVAVYGGENTIFPLGRYTVVQEDGVWKWCGEAA